MENTSQGLLRGALTGNGLFSILSGLAAAVFAAPLGDLMGISWVVLLVVGFGVIGFGIVTLMNARRQPINLAEAKLTIVADIVWVGAAAVIVLIPGLLTADGNLLLGGVSVVVAVFAILQSIGIRQSASVEPRRLVTEVEIEASPEEVWRVLVDLDAYKTWNPFIIEGVGTVDEGESLKLRMSPSGGKAMTFTPVVTEADRATSFEWLGSVVILTAATSYLAVTVKMGRSNTVRSQFVRDGNLVTALLSKELAQAGLGMPSSSNADTGYSGGTSTHYASVIVANDTEVMCFSCTS